MEEGAITTGEDALKSEWMKHPVWKWLRIFFSRFTVLTLMILTTLSVVTSTSQVKDRQQYVLHVEKILRGLDAEINILAVPIFNGVSVSKQDQKKYDELHESKKCFDHISAEARLLIFGPPNHHTTLKTLQNKEIACLNSSPYIAETNSQHHSGIVVVLMTWPRMYSSSQLMMFATILSGWVGAMVYILLKVGRNLQLSLLRRFGGGIGAGIFVSLLASSGSGLFPAEMEAVNTSDPYALAMVGFLAGLFSDDVFEWLGKKVRDALQIDPHEND